MAQIITQVRSQVWQPYTSMDYAQYGGTPYLSNQNFGWSHHTDTSWNTSYTTPHTPQVQRSNLDEKVGELERLHAELVLENAEFRRPRAEMDYSQVRLPRFLDQNETSQPPHGKMTKLEATMAELERVCVECTTSQARFMNGTRATLQIQSSKLERLEVQVGQMTNILLEEQQRSLPTLEEPIREEEYDTKELKYLVVKEDEPTSLESNENIIDDVVNTTPEMAPWGELHEELKNEKMTPIPKTDEPYAVVS